MSPRHDDISKTIEFIKLIEENPCLWDYSLKTYSRSDITTLAWKMLAEKIGDTEHNCRDRWKNIRTAFGRSTRLSRKPYYLATYLDFLRPYLKGASTSGNLLEEDSLQDAQAFHEEEVSPMYTPDIIVEEPLSNSESEIWQDPTPDKRRRISSRQCESEKSFVECLELETKDSKTILVDGDWFFFRSLLQDFKKLNDKRRRDLKLRFAALLYEELDRADNEAETKLNSNDRSSKSNRQGGTTAK